MKAREDARKRKMSKQKHSLNSYYLKQDKKNTIDSEMKGQYDAERLADLAQPVNKEVFKAMHLAKEEIAEKEGKNVKFDKQYKIAKGLKSKGKIEFGDYVDRDVAPIRGDTGEFSTSVKTSKGLKSFDTAKSKKDLF